MLNAIQKRVEEKLKADGIEVYFYNFEMDDGRPYFAYTFDKEIVDEAKEYWKNGFMPMNCYDDYSFEEDMDNIVNDIYLIVSERKNEIN